MRFGQPFLFVATLILITLLAGSCNSKKDILAEKIQYDVPIVGGDAQLDWWINNIEGSKREPFVKRIMEAAEKGEVRIYDYFNKPLTPGQIQAITTDTIYRTLTRTYPPYEEFDTMTVESVSWHDINKIRFLEEWNWDPQTLEITKKVLGIGPVVTREYGGEKVNQLLFWIYFDDRLPGK
jgi:hypothetical protein